MQTVFALRNAPKRIKTSRRDWNQFEAKFMRYVLKEEGWFNTSFLISPLYQAIRTFDKMPIRLRAGEGIMGVLLSLFNDSSEEAKLLALQLDSLKSQLNFTRQL